MNRSAFHEKNARRRLARDTDGKEDRQKFLAARSARRRLNGAFGRKKDEERNFLAFGTCGPFSRSILIGTSDPQT